MTVSFIQPTPRQRYAEFFVNGSKFLGITYDDEEYEFEVINQSQGIVICEQMMCRFNFTTWILTTDIVAICQFREIIPI